MGFDEKGNEVPETPDPAAKTAAEDGSGDEESLGLERHRSESSIALTEDEDEEEDRKIELGPQFTLKEQLEKDKVVFLFFGCVSKSSMYLILCLIYVLCSFPFEVLG